MTDSELSENTLRAYKADWQCFHEWWGKESLPVPDHVLEQYLGWCEKTGLATTTILRRAAALSWQHRKEGVYNPMHSPRLRDAVGRVRRRLENQSTSWSPTPDDELRAKLARLVEDDELRTLRNRAITSLAHSSQLRRSEIAALRYDALEPTTRGLLVHPPRINSYRHRDARPEFIDYRDDDTLCPWKLIERWTMAAAIASGPVFRPLDQWGNLEPNAICGKTVRRVLKPD